jgi:hypothetical protein
MYLYLIGSNPVHAYDDEHDEVALTHWLQFDNEEFIKQCKEAINNLKDRYPSSNVIAKYLIEHDGYKEVEYQAFFDINSYKKE